MKCGKAMEIVADYDARVLLFTKCVLSRGHFGPHKLPPGLIRRARDLESGPPYGLSDWPRADWLTLFPYRKEYAERYIREIFGGGLPEWEVGMRVSWAVVQPRHMKGMMGK